MTKRVAWVDVAKALGLACVVLGHARLPIYPWFYNFHMPLFFLISGLFFRDAPSFVRRQARNYLKPFYLWSVLFLVTDLLMTPELWVLRMDLTNILIGDGTLYHLWFLFGLFFVEVLYYGLHHLLRDRRWILPLTAAAALLANEAVNRGIPNQLHWASILQALFFFAAGVRIGSPDKIQKHFSPGNWLLGLLASIVVTVVTLRVTGSCMDLAHGHLQIPVFSWLGALGGSFFICNTAAWLAHTPFSGFLQYIGRNTLIFYPIMGYFPRYLTTLFTRLAWDIPGMGLVTHLLAFGLGFAVTGLTAGKGGCIHGKHRTGVGPGSDGPRP